MLVRNVIKWQLIMERRFLRYSWRQLYKKAHLSTRCSSFAVMIFALAVAVLGCASPVFCAHSPVRLRDLAKRGGTVTGPVIPTDFPDPGLLLPNGQPPWYVCKHPAPPWPGQGDDCKSQ